MEEKLASYKVAVLAKEVEFEDIVGTFQGKHYYNYLGELDGDVTEEIKHRKETPNLYKSIAAPTQSLLQKYLREIHNIHIEMLYIDQILKFQAEICMMNSNTIVSDVKCGNYEDVLEEALEIALNLIKDDNNRSKRYNTRFNNI